jgi:hypothetical protein
MEARADDVLGPSGVRCEAVAHVEGRPQGKQYDHECIATFQNGGVMHCIVPAGEDGRMSCSPALMSDAPYPAIYQRK